MKQYGAEPKNGKSHFMKEMNNFWEALTARHEEILFRVAIAFPFSARNLFMKKIFFIITSFSHYILAIIIGKGSRKFKETIKHFFNYIILKSGERGD